MATSKTLEQIRSVIAVIAFAFALNGYCEQGALPGNEQDRSMTDSLNAVAENLIQSKKYSEAKVVLDSALTLAHETGYRAGEGTTCLHLGDLAYDSRNFIESESYGDKALVIFRELGLQSSLAKAYLVWGTAIWAQSRFVEAINAFEKARGLYAVLHDSIGLGSSNSLLALAEEERGNYEKSFQYSVQALAYDSERASIAIGQLYADVGDYDAALKNYAKVTENDLKISNYLKVGEAYFLEKNYDSALCFYKEFIKDNRGLGDKVNSKPFLLMGEVFLAQNRYDTALHYLQIALDGFREVNDRNWIMRSLLQLGKAYRQLNQPEKSLKAGRELLIMAQRSGAKQYARDAHYLLYELFAVQNETDSAYRHLRRYTALDSSIAIDVSGQKLAFFKASAQLDQANLKIDLLNRQHELQEEEIKQAAQLKWVLILAVIILIVVFIIIGRNFFLKKRNAEHLQQLAANELQIEKLEHTRRLGELEMQVLRVQMNPHFIFNSLNSINRFILRDNRTDASAYLTKLSRLVRMILQNSQNALISLESEIQSLVLYLDLEKLRFDNLFEYEIVAQEGIDPSMIKVPPLILQPFVENGVWHGLMPRGKGGRIEIRISIDEDYLFVKISDNGVGREVAAASHKAQTATHRSLGLSITSQRINMMHHDGKVDSVFIADLVDSAGKPAGTAVTIKLPLLND